jgi:hypothetical protein
VWEILPTFGLSGRIFVFDALQGLPRQRRV